MNDKEKTLMLVVVELVSVSKHEERERMMSRSASQLYRQNYDTIFSKKPAHYGAN